MIYTPLFEKCISVILKNEGGYVNNPSDYGGETKYGIAKRFFPQEDIKNLTIERAKYLYFHKYWVPMSLEGIKDELSVLHIFDMGVNAGKQNAIKLAQEVVDVETDGSIGPITTKAINDYLKFVEHYKEARGIYYRNVSKIRNNRIFLNGWLARIEKTHF